MPSTPLPVRLRRAGALVAAALCALFAYTLVHEGGHALVGLLAGQRLVEFDVSFFTLGAHARMAGDIAGAWRSLQTIAGAGLARGGQPGASAPPPGYDLEISLSQQAYDAYTVYSFTLEQPAKVGVWALAQDVDTPYLDIALEGPDGYRNEILHGEGYAASRDNMSFTLQLEPGAYRLVVTNRVSPGRVAVYLKLN